MTTNRWLMLLFAAIIVSFILGRAWQTMVYRDTCLDLGGGMNPGNHPICVLPEAR